MLHLSALFVPAALAQPAPTRFVTRYAFAEAGLPPITVDSFNTDYGIAHQMARQAGRQARLLWVDGTANLDRVASDDRVTEVVRNAVECGFNLLVFDVKPISGQVLYQSKLAPKIETWRGRSLPRDYDPLPAMVRETKRQGLSMVVSLNALSEGHNLFKAGPGYERVEQQTVIYHPEPIVQPLGVPGFPRMNLSPQINQVPTGRQLGVFTDPARIPNPSEDLFAVSLDARSRVVDGYEFGGMGGGVPALPRGGSILVGRGEPGEWLRRYAVPGRVMRFNDVPRFVPISEFPGLQFPLMMNVHRPDVRKAALNIITELLVDFGVRGIVYDDRLRYAGNYADFSPAARNAFESYVDRKLVWPDDVFRFTYTVQMQRGVRPGPYYDAWMAWRAKTMTDFVEEVKLHIRRLDKSALFGVYAGSWYGEYPKFGTNFGADNVESGFWFMTDAYRRTGFAKHLDFLVTGCYYPTATIFEAMSSAQPVGRTVEAAGQLSNRIVNDQTWVYAGIALDQFKNNPEGLANALQAAAASTQGVMVFDYSHDFAASKAVFQRAFRRRQASPHEDPTLIRRVAERKRQLIRQGYRERPIPILSGAEGVGF